MSSPTTLVCVELLSPESKSLLFSYGIMVTRCKMFIQGEHNQVLLKMRNGNEYLFRVNNRSVDLSQHFDNLRFWPLRNTEAYSSTVLEHLEIISSTNSYWKHVKRTPHVLMIIYDMFHFRLKNYSKMYENQEKLKQMFEVYRYKYENAMDDAIERDTWVCAVFNYDLYMKVEEFAQKH